VARTCRGPERAADRSRRIRAVGSATWLGLLTILLLANPAGASKVQAPEARSTEALSEIPTWRCDPILVAPLPTGSYSPTAGIDVGGVDKAADALRHALVAPADSLATETASGTIEVLGSTLSPIKLSQAEPGRRVGATETSTVEVRTAGSTVQVVGQAPAGGLLTLSVRIDAACPDDGVIRIEPRGEAAMVVQYDVDALERIEPNTPQRNLGAVNKPWAVDVDGSQLKTWFEFDETILRQVVDARSADGLVTFDPTYNPTNCEGGHWTDANAGAYLDLYTPSTVNHYYCPPPDWFVTARGYFPQGGYEELLARTYGWVLVTPTTAGDACSPPSGETGPSFDFWIPCQAHDLCYDLRGAGFDQRVTDSECDGAFWWMMEAHCSQRSIFLQPSCRQVRDTYAGAVSLPGVITYASPPALKFRPTHAGNQCIDVPYANTAVNIAIQQWACNGLVQQKFRPWQNPDGSFRIMRIDVGARCFGVIATYGWSVAQRDCWSVPSQQVTFKIAEWWNQDKYQLLSLQNTNWCVSVPGSNPNSGTNLIEWPCSGTPNQLWWMNGA